MYGVVADEKLLVTAKFSVGSHVSDTSKLSFISPSHLLTNYFCFWHPRNSESFHSTPQLITKSQILRDGCHIKTQPQMTVHILALT